MINGSYSEVKNELLQMFKHSKTIRLWVCYFEIKTNVQKIINIKPTLTLLTESMFSFNGSLKIKDNGDYIKFPMNEFDYNILFFSESKDNCINKYNSIIFATIKDLNGVAEELKNKYNIIIDEIKYSKSCFIETDYIMEKLIRE